MATPEPAASTGPFPKIFKVKTSLQNQRLYLLLNFVDALAGVYCWEVVFGGEFFVSFVNGVLEILAAGFKCVGVFKGAAVGDAGFASVVAGN